MSIILSKPIIGITIGDVGGIGPEVSIKSALSRDILKIATPLLIGNLKAIKENLKIVKSNRTLNVIRDMAEIKSPYKYLNVYPTGSTAIKKVKFGVINSEYGKLAFDFIKTAIDLAVSGEISAICTAPISKKSLNEAGYNYDGHTEIFAEFTKTKDYAMMFIAGNLRVVLVTIHKQLRKIFRQITIKNIYKKIYLTHKSMKLFGIREPRIAVAGINPHASENGLFGDEEKNIIIPAIEKAKMLRIKVEGPFPADTLFKKCLDGIFDVAIAMYHDQGLIPIKTTSFYEGVNLTLGLPIIRTSPDHGTAFDIAGKGIANPKSMIKAIEIAVKMVSNKQ